VTEDAADRRQLASVLFTDIVDSTTVAASLGDARWRELLDRHDAGIRQLLQRHGGREVKTLGDGFVAAFDSPASAVRCALEAVDSVRPLGLEIRTGVHTGECELRGQELTGIAVHIAARIAAMAGAGEVLISSTVRDLVAGSDIRTVKHGSAELKGLSGRWQLFAALSSSTEGARGVTPASQSTAREPAPEASPKTRSGRLAVLVVDDHPLWRQTLASVLEVAGVARAVLEAGDGAEAVKIAQSRHPDVIVMDMELPRMSGVEAIRAIVAEQPEARIVVLSSTDERNRVLDAVRAGALGYLIKTAAPDEVADAVRRVHAGEAVFPAALAGVVLGELRAAETRKPVRVVVAAGSLLDREGLARLLQDAGFEIVATAADPAELDGLVASDGTELIRVAADAPQGWVDAVAALRTRERPPPVLVLGSTVDASQAGRLLAAGHRGIGYLLKERVSALDDLATAVRRVVAGEAVLDPAIVRDAVLGPAAADPLAELSERELKVLALIAAGQSNQAIGEGLFMSPKTVEAHVSTIFGKLGLEDAPESNRRVLAAVSYLRSRPSG